MDNRIKKIYKEYIKKEDISQFSFFTKFFTKWLIDYKEYKAWYKQALEDLLNQKVNVKILKDTIK